MKIFIINADYPKFLSHLYAQNPGLASQNFEEQQVARAQSFFGISDVYPRLLRERGHDAVEVFANNAPMQRAWASEHNVRVTPERPIRFRLRKGLVPWVARRPDSTWMYDILRAQIDHYQPDIVLNHHIGLDSAFFTQIKPRIPLLVGQHAAELPSHDLSMYDLILSSLPNQVEYFRSLGVPSEHFKLGFDERVLDFVPTQHKRYDVIFVGGVGQPHTRRTTLLESLCERYRVGVFGYGLEKLDKNSPLRAVHGGELWGLDMYRALASAKVVINYHSDVAGPFANNMRLYETTGVGTALLTEEKRNLHEMFTPQVQVATYHSPVDCLGQIDRLVRDDTLREKMALAGQNRTLRDHTYRGRIDQLIDIFEHRLPASRKRWPALAA
ncbi:MAG: glycosyltransferase [Phycisphaera sp.]|nr:glycosyltransferase [Phycisphaera sp.]